MSTNLATIQQNLPAELRQQFAAQIQADVERLGAIGGKDAIRVTQDKKFELPNGDVLDSIEVVIVDFVYRNEYYIGQFNRKEISPPACFAISPTAATMEPSENSPVKQHDDCITCQQNQWGSNPTGEGKACKNTVYMAVLPANADAETPIWTLKTSATAVKPFNAYVSKIARDAGLPIHAVVTKLFFDPSSTFASVRCEVIGANQGFALAKDRQNEARARLCQEPDVSNFKRK